MLYEECEYCKNHYNGKYLSDGCSRVWYEFETDDEDMPIRVDNVCHGFKRKGLFKDFPYAMTKKQTRDLVAIRLHDLLNDYSANDLLNILHEDLAKDVESFLMDYFYDAAILNGVKIKEE